MIYHTVYVEWDKNRERTSGPKGMGDIAAIIERCGITSLVIPSQREKKEITLKERVTLQRKTFDAWKKACAVLEDGDWLIVDLPLLDRFLWQSNVFEELKKRGVHLAFFLADLDLLTKVKYDSLSGLKSALLRKAERYVLKNAELIIAHNIVYKRKLRALGVKCPIVYFGIFDYLAPGFDIEKARGNRRGKDGAAIIAANLKPVKSEYVYMLPDNYDFNLYGVHYEGSSYGRVSYKGAFGPEELMEEMEGSYGLVWDGESIDGCTGNYGDYIRYNNPHRTSLYLASGIPVIVWRRAAIARFIEDNECGLLIDSLGDIEAVTQSLTEEAYERMRVNAEAVGERLRAGFYTEGVLKEAIECMTF